MTTRRTFLQLTAGLIASSALVCAAQTMQPWLTRSHDNQRSNWNSQETVLSQASLIAKGLSLKVTVPICCDARGMEAQPLIVPQVQTTKGLHDLLVLPSMSDYVRIVDAHTGADIFDFSLGTPINGGPKIDAYSLNQFWGCLGTGVVSGTNLYQLCWVSPDKTGDPATGVWQMFTVNIASGTVTGAVTLGGGSPPFSALTRKIRASLALYTYNGHPTVIGCAGTVYETEAGSAGYVFAFDTVTSTFPAVQALTQGRGAGCWMAGQGPLIDSTGNIYLLTGNGDFSPSTQLGESLLKIRHFPAGGSCAQDTTPCFLAPNAGFTVTDWWTPWTDDQRTGQVLTANAAMKKKLSGTSRASTELVNAGMTPAAMATGAWADEDWGSSGPACIFQIGICVAAGKDGIAYPVKVSNMGHPSVATVLNSAADCALLAAPPQWVTVYGVVPPCPTNPQALNIFPYGKTHHEHATPVQMYDPLLKSWTLFFWGENERLHKWAVSSTGQLTYIAEGNEYASVGVQNSPGGMPGGFCTGSSNGGDANSAILVCVVPIGDANKTITKGRMIVYDPVHTANGTIPVLWDSQKWGWSFDENKFMNPVIDDGLVYYPTYDGTLLILGLSN